MKILNNCKWYRKLRGGSWYYNRYIFDAGRDCIFVWERVKGNTTGGSGYNVKIESYDEN